jgi:cytochrome c-type protein NapC
MNLIKRIICTLREPSAKISLGALLFGGFILGLLFIGSANGLMNATNSLEFCVSCHTMSGVVYEEYQESLHYKNKSGVRAECPDCHVPKPFGRKLIAKIYAVKDVWHEMIGTVDTPEKFAAKRYEMAERVWGFMRRTDSATCRSCHSWTGMELEAQGRQARRKHARAEEEGETCIECHMGIAHEIPDEPEEEAEGEEST